MTGLIFLVVLGVIMTIVFFIGAISGFREKNNAVGFGMLLMDFCCGLMLYVSIVAVKCGNIGYYEYHFPAENYELRQEITISTQEVYINGEKVVGETRDTTYILSGFEPMLIKDPPYTKKTVKYGK